MSISRTTNKNSTDTSSSSGGGGGAAAAATGDFDDTTPLSDDPVELQKENVQLRVKNEELTRLLMKTVSVVLMISKPVRALVLMNEFFHFCFFRAMYYLTWKVMPASRMKTGVVLCVQRMNK